MKNLYLFTLGLCLLATTVFPAKAAYSSIYVFGDALSATDDTSPEGSPGPPDYYGFRDSNGRVWVEVLAQRQGVPLSYNDSYYDHGSLLTVADVNSFIPPVDITNDLFIVWVCNSDTFDAAQVPDTSSQWTAAINQSQANHLQIITNLYAKGVRTLIMPNVVDISTVPAFNQDPATGVMHNGCIAYNVAFSNTINQARSMCPGLTIYTPDFFTLLNNVLTNAAYYGLSNALSGGFSVDAYSSVASLSLSNNPGPNYIFWDTTDPTARLHAVMADIVQQLLSPVQVGKITSAVGSNRLDIVNYPAGLEGFVDGVPNLGQTNWTTVQNFSSTNVTQSVFVQLTGPRWYYRLRFPYAWSWP